MLKLLLVKLFLLFIESIVVLYFRAILYKLSPDCTIYVISEDLTGILRTIPIFNKLVFKLFIFIISLTLVLYLLAILYKLSPFFTT